MPSKLIFFTQRALPLTDTADCQNFTRHARCALHAKAAPHGPEWTIPDTCAVVLHHVTRQGSGAANPAVYTANAEGAYIAH
jgi:hypothetical protein